jgi:small multidrug resistance pump
MEFLFISLIVMAETAGQGFLKEYSAHVHPSFLLLGAVCYFAVVVLLAKTMQQGEGMGVVNLLWSVASIISVFAVGMIFFHERMTGVQMFGAAMSVMGVAILKMA